MRESTTAAPNSRVSALEALVSTLSSSLESERQEFESKRQELAERIAKLEKERDLLRSSHEQLRLELELLKKRIFVATAERVDTKQMELEFNEKMRELEALAETLKLADPPSPDEGGEGSPEGESEDDKKKRGGKKSVRRDLRKLPLQEVRVEVPDPVLEQLVAEGKAVRRGAEETYKLARQRGGMRRLVVVRFKYEALEAVNDSGVLKVFTAEMPPEIFPSGIATPSLVAHVASRKFCEGMPLNRLEDAFRREGVPVDRATMSRWLEHLGATVGATVVQAMREHALHNAFCIATDATGIRVQPARSPERKRQAAKKGHFLVQVADRDHLFFEYLERETSAAIGEVPLCLRS